MMNNDNNNDNDNGDEKIMIDKQDFSPMSRLCGEREETVSHITTEIQESSSKAIKQLEARSGC